MATIVASQLAIFTIESTQHPGYNLAQLGTQVLLMAANKDDPRQLWYVDDSWRFVGSISLINMATKKALKCPPSSNMKVVVGAYDPSIGTDKSFLWFASSNTLEGPVSLRSRLYELGLTIGVSRNKKPDGIPVILTDNYASCENWRFILHEARPFKIQCSWVNQMLTYKTPYTTVKYLGMPTEQTDENNVIGIHPDEKSGDVPARQIWYRIPAGGQEDTNTYTSFIIVNKSTGLALKGSSKPGEKVMATEFDPLDYDFVWAEDRAKTATYTFVNINLSKEGSTQLYWLLPEDGAYQNTAWYHPLTVSQGTRSVYWKFIPQAG